MTLHPTGFPIDSINSVALRRLHLLSVPAQYVFLGALGLNDSKNPTQDLKSVFSGKEFEEVKSSYVSFARKDFCPVSWALVHALKHASSQLNYHLGGWDMEKEVLDTAFFILKFFDHPILLGAVRSFMLKVKDDSSLVFLGKIFQRAQANSFVKLRHDFSGIFLGGSIYCDLQVPQKK